MAVVELVTEFLGRGQGVSGQGCPKVGGVKLAGAAPRPALQQCCYLRRGRGMPRASLAAT